MSKQVEILEKAKEVLAFLKERSDTKHYGENDEHSYKAFHKVTLEVTVDGIDMKVELTGDD